MSTTTNGRLAGYTANLGNHYESRGVPGAFDVLGSAPVGVSVLVGGEVPLRAGEFFHQAVAVDNASSPVFESVTILAALPGDPDEVASETREAFVAETPEEFVHDLDGNLVQDGRWIYVWDAENRLIEMATRADVATASGLLRQKLVFGYDGQGRRVRKQVFAWTGSAWSTSPSSDLRFLYDGWNLLAEYDALASNAVLRSHVWGLDLSGTIQGAGGVGGLLWTSTTSATYAPGWDANGNIVAWLDLADGTVSGRRDYGAFGEAVATTGNAAELPFAFSTKYRDEEAELYYYGYRYYNPSTGRWMSRGPIAERGGLNLYGMVGNNAINYVDYLGLYQLAQLSGSTEDVYIVDQCEILIVYGHRTVKGRTARIVTPHSCSAAAASVCQPGAANGSVTRLLDGAEMHDDVMRFSNTEDSTANPYGIADGADRTNSYQGINKDGHIDLAQLRDEAQRKAKELLKSCKCPGGVTISGVRRGLGPKQRDPILVK